MKKRVFFIGFLFLLMLSFSCGAHLISKEGFTQHHKRVVGLKLFGEVDPNWSIFIESAIKSADGGPVLLEVESPGGYVSVSIYLNDFIEKMKEKYKSDIYVYTQYGLYSGAYFMAAACDGIYAAPSSEVGSIGVVYQIEVTPRKDKETGIETWTFKSGDFKWIGQGDTLTKAQIDYLQGTVDKYQTLFLNTIIDGRNKQLGKVIGSLDREDQLKYLRQVCDGRVYFPEEALNLGLIDGIGYVDDVLKCMKAVYGLDEVKVYWRN